MHNYNSRKHKRQKTFLPKNWTSQLLFQNFEKGWPMLKGRSSVPRFNSTFVITTYVQMPVFRLLFTICHVTDFCLVIFCFQKMQLAPVKWPKLAKTSTQIMLRADCAVQTCWYWSLVLIPLVITHMVISNVFLNHNKILILLSGDGLDTTDDRRQGEQASGSRETSRAGRECQWKRQSKSRISARFVRYPCDQGNIYH